MDPLTVVMSALQLADNDMVKDAYAGLKALIVRKFGATNTSVDPIDNYAADPDGYHVLAQRALTAAGAPDDPEIRAAAEQVLQQAEAVSPGTTIRIGKVVADRNSQVNIAGGSQTVTNTNTRPG